MAEDSRLVTPARSARALVRYGMPWLLLLVLTTALHLWRLGDRSFHHDESIHAHTSYQLLHHGTYRYDPTYHGPLLYYLTTLSFAVFGDSDFTARLPIAVAGVLLVVVAWFVRRPFGAKAAWWTGLLVSISPLCLYYGRFLRMDILELGCASAAAVAAYNAARGSERAWLWLGLWAGLAVATKENSYVTMALVAVVWAVTAVGTSLGPYLSKQAGGPRSSERREEGVLTRLLDTWEWLATRARRLVITGARHLPAAVLEATARLGAWSWQQRWGVVAATAIAVIVLVPAYTVGFTDPGGVLFFGKAISYWWGQHAAQRVAGPWWFHLPRLLQYEFLPIAAALVWVWRRRRRLRTSERALFLFGSCSIAMYCYLGEKVPWLGVHQVWAFFPLAGAQLARTFSCRGKWWSRTLAILALAATAVSAVVASFVVDEISPALPRVESMVYVQTSPEMKAVVREGLELAAAGEYPLAAVESEAAWPLSWYWRAQPVHWGLPEPGARPALVICDAKDEIEARRRVGVGYRRQVVPLRSWWVPERGPTCAELLRYAVTRVPWGQIGASTVVVMRRTSQEVAGARDVAVPEPLQQQLGVTAARVIGQAQLLEPRGIAARNGELVVADTVLSRVLHFDPLGELVPAATSLEFDRPEAVAWLESGELLVADTWRHRVVRINEQAKAVELLRTPPDGWYGPRSVAVSPDGAVAVADTGNKRLVVYPYVEAEPEVWGRGGSELGELVEPGGLAWIDNNRLLVCDTGNKRLQVFDREAQAIKEIPLPEAWKDFYSRPQVAVLDTEVFLASDTPAGSLWLITGEQVTALHLRECDIIPTGVCWDAGRLYVGDLGGRVWELLISDDWLQRHKG